MSEQTSIVTNWLGDVRFYRDAARERRAEAAVKSRRLRAASHDYEDRLVEHADAAITAAIARERLANERRRYAEYLNCLSRREALVIRYLHLDDNAPYPITEVANRLRVPVARVRELEASAIEHLERRIRMDVRAGGRGGSPRVQ